MKASYVVSLAILAGVMLVPATGLAQGDDERSLEKCQKTAGKEIGKYAAAYQKTVAKCLDKIAKELIKDVEVDASGAAKPCVSALRKLENSDKPDKELAAKTSDKIGKRCDPTHEKFSGAHTAQDVLGDMAGATVAGDAIEAEELGEWCDSFGVGGGSIGSVQDWIDCQLAAATCQARQQLVAEYPNVLTWLNEVRDEIVALDGGCDSSCAGCNDLKNEDACSAVDALELAIDGGTDDDLPDIACGPSTCGNGVVEIGESCDGSDLNGETCTTFGFAAGGTLACTDECELHASSCGASGIPSRFRDNGDLTATDLVSGLTWEMKVATVGSIHAESTPFAWTSTGTAPDGSAFEAFLVTLNSRCDDDEATPCTTDDDCSGAPDDFASNDLCGHAGHRDWRLPTLPELRGLLTEPHSLGTCPPPCLAPELPGLTSLNTYWTSTEVSSDPTLAWGVTFSNGFIGNGSKFGSNRLRAVRGGS